MRLTRDQAARNRDAILETTAREFRRRGFDAVGIADLMKAAGFTHGGFYNHFTSKAALAAAVCATEIARSNLGVARDLAGVAQAKAWRGFLGRYLARGHRDDPAGGCTIAALAADAGRQPRPVPQRFADGLEAVLAILTAHLGGPGRRARALRAWSEMVGALVLSRAVASANPALADEILAASRRGLSASPSPGS